MAGETLVGYVEGMASDQHVPRADGCAPGSEPGADVAIGGGVFGLK
jgi:hypothetical protein